MVADGTILIVTPDDSTRERLERNVRLTGRAFLATRTRREALKALSRLSISVIITAARLPDGGWQDFLSDTAPMASAPSIAVISSSVDPLHRTEVLACGCYLLPADSSEPANVLQVLDGAVHHWVNRCRPQWSARLRTSRAVAGTGVDSESGSLSNRESTKLLTQFYPTGSSLGLPFTAAPGNNIASAAAVTVSEILAVDDDSMVLSLIARILTEEDFKIWCATDGQRGVDLFCREPGIALVILDWRMPGMSGVETFDALSAIRPDVKIIVTTGESLVAVQHAFSGRKVMQFLPKPFRIRSLVSAVTSAIAA